MPRWTWDDMKDLRLKPDAFLMRRGGNVPDKYGYAKQKLYEAVLSLSGTGSLQERLTHAALPLVTLRSPAQGNPEDIREELDSIVNLLTAKPLSGAAGYPPRDLSDDEANKVGKRIVSLFVKVMGGL